MSDGHAHKEPASARRRLMDLGVAPEAINKALATGHLARINCTDNDPPFIPGTEAWRYVVRTLREELLPKGWRKSDPGNFSLVTSDERQINIVVASGDALTCRFPGTPKTKSLKGLFTEAAILRNNVIGDLFPETLEEDLRRAAAILDYKTYILLIHITDEGFRAELSLPEMIEDGNITSWTERIFIPENDASPYSLDGADEGSGSGIDVPVRRKA
jgi:hypothetical protein